MTTPSEPAKRRDDATTDEIRSLDWQLQAMQEKNAAAAAEKTPPKQAVTDDGEVGPEFLADS